MKVKCLVASSALALMTVMAPAVQADVLNTGERTNQMRSTALPSRGQSMAQVEQRLGAPLSRLSPAGGDSNVHPVIHRWQYQGFTVYFERDRVLHSVMDTPPTRGS